MKGRPTKYDESIADEICEMIATTTAGLNAICKMGRFPAPSTIYLWLTKHKEFSEKYTYARERQADLMGEQILSISDDTSRDTVVTDSGEHADSEWISRSRLRVDARKWLMSKLHPKKYGDKIDLTSKGEALTIKVVRE
jgi:hypothetical protein